MKISLLFLVSLLFSQIVTAGTNKFENFITRQGDKLYDGKDEYRFISFNIPCLHYLEDEMQFTETMPFRFPDEFEIEDALKTVHIMGGNVARTYVFSVRRESDWDTRPVHILGPEEFNEEAFVAMDKVISLANNWGVRLIIPIINGSEWWGGYEEYAAFFGGDGDDFCNDPEIIEAYKKTITQILTRVNTITGVPYNDDKAILAWETSNELDAPAEWTTQIAKHIKEVAPKQLVIDGYYDRGVDPNTDIPQYSIDDSSIDFIQTHHYEKDPEAIIQTIRSNAARTRGKKPYHVGEIGFLSTAGIEAVLDTVIEEELSGALIWSLRRHHRDGGFTWHSEPFGGDFFKAYHFPGFYSGEVYDEIAFMDMMRQKAFEIRGVNVPELPIPDAPTLLAIDSVHEISWRGSVGASSYQIERSLGKSGNWKVLAAGVSDAEFQYKPLYNDNSTESGKSYYYRIRAVNKNGISNPSNMVGPVIGGTRRLVDEFTNHYKMFDTVGGPVIEAGNARKFKEDIHRLSGKEGDSITYYVSGSINDARIYSFSEIGDENYIFSVSSDTTSYEVIESDRTSYAGEKSHYGYWTPTLFEIKNTKKSFSYLKIEFKSPSQISRIEVDYAK